MDTAEIRRRFISHFEERGHTVVPSASLILDDPNLLFVNAGMVQFKPYFLGQETPPYPRAVSVQKCVRTLDIEEVGKTTRHGTFFQMNGNFSFGNYFKEGAIELAWELVTKPQDEGGYGFDESLLYASVYHEDDEAIGYWKKVAGLPDDRIIRLGKKDNYWSHGRPGPGRAVQRDPHRPRPRVRRRPRLGCGRPLPGVLEPRLHAGRAQRRPVEGGLRHQGVAAAAQHRHRHGPGAGRLPAPGQGQHVRDRRDVPGHREGLGAVRPPLRRGRGRRARRRRALPGRRRPRPQRDDAHRRRGHPRQRGPGLRPASPAPPGGPVDAPAGRGGPRSSPSCSRSAGTR